MAQSSSPALPAILVVEDEAVIRMDLADQLGSTGHDVYEACNADEAIAMMEAHAEIRFLVTDIEMPGSMDGIKLSHYVRRRWPPVKIFVASGRRTPSASEMPDGSVFISKPYHSDGLRPIFDAVGSGSAG